MPWQPLPDPDGEPPTPVSEPLDRVVRALGAPPSTSLTTIFATWDRVVGSAIAGATTPLSLDRGTLVVAVRDGGWASQLRWMEPELLAKIADAVGEGVVRHLEVRVRPDGAH